MSIDYKGRLIEAGYVYNVNTDTSSIVIARYRTDGKADSTLGKSGFLVTKLGKTSIKVNVKAYAEGRNITGVKYENYACTLKMPRARLRKYAEHS